MASPTARLVIFDMAGTTVQLAVDVAHVLKESFLTHGLLIPDDTITSYRGASKREAISLILQERQVQDVDVTRLYGDFQGRLLSGLETEGIKPVDGVERTFDKLHATGVRVVLTTGFDRVIVDHMVGRLGWAGRIDGVVTGDDVLNGRPSPDMIFSGMEQVGESDVNRVVVVGDTVNDMKAGHRAGAGAIVGVLTGAHDLARLLSTKPTAILNSVADLPSWLGLPDV